MSSENLFLSTKSVIEDYSLLLAYMKKCKERSLNCTQLIPSSQLLGELQRRIELEPLSLEKIVEIVKEKVEHIIDCDLCAEAFREVYKVTVTCEDAKKMLLKQLAGWYVEILEALGYVKVRYAWKT